MERNKRRTFRSIWKFFSKFWGERKAKESVEFLSLEPSREWIIWSVCLLATIRGIRNLVSSLSSIEGSTIRGREGVDTGVGKRRVRVAVNLEMPSVRGTVTYCRLAMINWNFKFYFPFNFRAQSLINCVRSSRTQRANVWFEARLYRGARWNKIRSKTSRGGGRASWSFSLALARARSMIRRNGGKIERNESTCSALRNGATTKLCYTLRVLNYLRNVYNALLPSLQEVRVKFLIAFTSFQFVRGVCFSSLNTFNIFGCFHSKCRLFLKTLLPSRVKYLSLHRQRTIYGLSPSIVSLSIQCSQSNAYKFLPIQRLDI